MNPFGEEEEGEGSENSSDGRLQESMNPFVQEESEVLAVKPQRRSMLTSAWGGGDEGGGGVASNPAASKHVMPQKQQQHRLAKAVDQEWCVECTAESVIVIRLMDQATAAPLVQLKLTYVVTVFGMPQKSETLLNPVLQCAGFGVKNGRRLLLFEKDTRATSNEWSSFS
jgi:hypothetical protein